MRKILFSPVTARLGLLTVLLGCMFQSRAGLAIDTIEYWHISYGKDIVLRGAGNTSPTSKPEIKIKQGVSYDLKISFNYDSGQPKHSSVTVKEGKVILKEVPGDLVMGAYFMIPVKELISLHQKDSRFELDFFYTDDRGKKNLKLGTLIFIVQ